MYPQLWPPLFQFRLMSDKLKKQNCAHLGIYGHWDFLKAWDFPRFPNMDMPVLENLFVLLENNSN